MKRKTMKRKTMKRKSMRKFKRVMKGGMTEMDFIGWIRQLSPEQFERIQTSDQFSWNIRKYENAGEWLNQIPRGADYTELTQKIATLLGIWMPASRRQVGKNAVMSR